MESTYISKVAFHPLDDINASNSILKYVNLNKRKKKKKKKKMWEVALNEKLSLDAVLNTRYYIHLKLKMS